MKENDNRRIKLRENFGEKLRIENNLQTVVDVANSRLIPLLKELNFAVSMANIEKYIVDADLLRNDFIEREITASGVENKYLQATIRREANAKFEENFAVYNYGNTYLNYKGLLALEKGVLSIDEEKVAEKATVYVEGATLVPYDKHQKIIELMNDLFNGKAPDDLEYWFFAKDGKVQAGVMISYQDFI